MLSYLQEYAPLGTAGGIYHFRDQIKSGNPSSFILMHGDVCGDFPLVDMMKFHQDKMNQALITIMGTEVYHSVFIKQNTVSRLVI